MLDIVKLVTMQHRSRDKNKIITKRYLDFEDCLPELKRIMQSYDYEWIQIREHVIDIAENKYHKENYLFFIEYEVSDKAFHTPVMDQLKELF